MKRFNFGNLICTAILVLTVAGLITLNSYVTNLTHGFYNIFNLLF